MPQKGKERAENIPLLPTICWLNHKCKGLGWGLAMYPGRRKEPESLVSTSDPYHGILPPEGKEWSRYCLSSLPPITMWAQYNQGKAPRGEMHVIKVTQAYTSGSHYKSKGLPSRLSVGSSRFWAKASQNTSGLSLPSRASARSFSTRNCDNNHTDWDAHPPHHLLPSELPNKMQPEKEELGFFHLNSKNDRVKLWPGTSQEAMVAESWWRKSGILTSHSQLIKHLRALRLSGFCP